MKSIFIKGVLAGIIYLLVLTPVKAQLNNENLADKIDIRPADSSTWGLSINNFNYLRNTEYFNSIELGRTLFGTQLHPSFFIQPNAYVKIQAGVFMQRDFGATPYINKVIPTFSIKLSSKNQQRSFTFGTLEGALAHRLIEPLFDINSAILNRIENGAQFKINSNRIFLDTWINWENFIEKGSPHKEQFTAGINFTPALVKTASGLSLSVPIQGTAFHRGGQIDADTTNMVMVFNAAAGLEFKQVWTSGFVKEVSLSAYQAYFKENSNSGYFPFRSGSGFYQNAFINTKWLGLMLSYWYAGDFIAPKGTVLYQSVSDISAIAKSRQLLFARFLYEKSLYDNLNLSARFEPVYDMNASVFDFSYSLYLSYRFNKSFGF